MSAFDFMKPAAPKPRIVPAPERTPAQAHNAEIAWRNSWVNDIRSASYFWLAVRNGETLLSEYDPCDETCQTEAVDPNAHLHKLSELPGKWQPVAVGEGVVYDEQQNEVRVPIHVPVFEATETFEPFILRAVPVTLDHQSLSEIEYTVAPGNQIVWGHRTISNRQVGGTHLADSLVFGVTDASTNKGSIVQAYADGTSEHHETLDSAYSGQLHPSLLPPEVKSAAPEPES